jgi:glycosyltransferase involved in cell wall biosynthesis
VNVLHVHSGNIFGGVERMLETLAPATAGVTPVHSSFALCFEGPVSGALRAAGGEVHQLGSVRARRVDEIRRARRALTDVLESQHWTAAIVHSAWSQAIFGPAILASGTALVRWLHAPQPGPRWLEYWSAQSTPQLVLCNSRFTSEGIGLRMGDTPRSIVYPPSVAQVPQAGDRQAVRDELGAAADAVVIIMAARLEFLKGHDLLLDALSTLPGGGWKAWIVGGPQNRSEQSYFSALANKAAEAGLGPSVRFLGQRADVPRLLAAADIYCQPNRGPDSFGLSFVEALAAGLPVVTTRLGAAPEIVTDRCGVLVEPGSSAALAQVLDGLVSSVDRRQAMSAAARERAQIFCDLPGTLRRLSAELAAVSATEQVRT